MDPLCYDSLSFEDKTYLRALSKHPGYVILRKLMEDACRQATEAVIKLNPESENYSNVLKSRQIVARTTNDFCATLVKSIVMHTEAAETEEKVNKEQEDLEEAGVSLDAKFGSVTIKPRNR